MEIENGVVHVMGEVAEVEAYHGERKGKCMEQQYSQVSAQRLSHVTGAVGDQRTERWSGQGNQDCFLKEGDPLKETEGLCL